MTYPTRPVPASHATKRITPAKSTNFARWISIDPGRWVTAPDYNATCVGIGGVQAKVWALRSSAIRASWAHSEYAGYPGSEAFEPWQDHEWPEHCGEPAAYLGAVGEGELTAMSAAGAQNLRVLGAVAAAGSSSEDKKRPEP